MDEQLKIELKILAKDRDVIKTIWTYLGSFIFAFERKVGSAERDFYPYDWDKLRKCCATEEKSEALDAFFVNCYERDRLGYLRLALEEQMLRLYMQYCQPLFEGVMVKNNHPPPPQQQANST